MATRERKERPNRAKATAAVIAFPSHILPRADTPPGSKDVAPFEHAFLGEFSFEPSWAAFELHPAQFFAEPGRGPDPKGRNESCSRNVSRIPPGTHDANVTAQTGHPVLDPLVDRVHADTRSLTGLRASECARLAAIGTPANSAPDPSLYHRELATHLTDLFGLPDRHVRACKDEFLCRHRSPPAAQITSLRVRSNSLHLASANVVESALRSGRTNRRSTP